MDAIIEIWREQSKRGRYEGALTFGEHRLFAMAALAWAGAMAETGMAMACKTMQIQMKVKLTLSLNDRGYFARASEKHEQPRSSMESMRAPVSRHGMRRVWCVMGGGSNKSMNRLLALRYNVV